MSQFDENKLIQLAQNGDDLAFEKLYSNYIPLINKFIKRHSRIDDIEGVINEQFFKATYAYDIKSKVKFITFLYNFFINAICKEHRKLNTDKRKGIINDIDKFLHLASNFAINISKIDLKMLIENNTFNDRDKIILKEYIIHKIPATLIGKRLKCSQQMVQYHAKNIRNILKDKMQEAI